MGDHLGSTSIITDSSGVVVSEIRYSAFGEIRYENGESVTDLLYTSQRLEEELGLYNYGARWYDPALGRFIQADSLIPDSTNPKAYDHYAYVNNNPLIYTDPDGECPLIVTALVGAAVGAVVNTGIQIFENYHSGMDFKEAVSNVDLAEVAVSAVAGGVAGLTMGVGTAVLGTASLGLRTYPKNKKRVEKRDEIQ